MFPSSTQAFVFSSDSSSNSSQRAPCKSPLAIWASCRIERTQRRKHRQDEQGPFQNWNEFPDWRMRWGLTRQQMDLISQISVQWASLMMEDQSSGSLRYLPLRRYKATWTVELFSLRSFHRFTTIQKDENTFVVLLTNRSICYAWLVPTKDQTSLDAFKRRRKLSSSDSNLLRSSLDRIDTGFLQRPWGQR